MTLIAEPLSVSESSGPGPGQCAYPWLSTSRMPLISHALKKELSQFGVFPSRGGAMGGRGPHISGGVNCPISTQICRIGSFPRIRPQLPAILPLCDPTWPTSAKAWPTFGKLSHNCGLWVDSSAMFPPCFVLCVFRPGFGTVCVFFPFVGALGCQRHRCNSRSRAGCVASLGRGAKLLVNNKIGEPGQILVKFGQRRSRVGPIRPSLVKRCLFVAERHSWPKNAPNPPKADSGPRLGSRRKF